MITSDGSLPWTKRALRVLHFAHQEARFAGSHSIGVEHLLLGLLRERHGMGAKILRTVQVDEDSVRHALSLPCPPQATLSVITSVPFLRWLRRWRRRSSAQLGWDALRLDEQAKRCFEKAAEEAQTLHVGFIGTEHLLFGVASAEQGEGAVEKAHNQLRLDASQIHEQVVRLYQHAHIMR